MKRKIIKKMSIIVCMGLSVMVSGVYMANMNEVTVCGAAKKIVKITPKKKTLVVGEKQKITVKGVNVKTVTWKSSKKSVATVSKKGVVKAKKAGKTTIFASVKFKNTKAVKKLKSKITVVAIDNAKKEEQTTVAATKAAEKATTRTTEVATTAKEANTTKAQSGEVQTTEVITTEAETPTAEVETKENNVLNRAAELVDSFESKDNIVVSPTSLDYILAILANSGNDMAKEQVEKYLGKDLNEINQYYYDLMVKAENDDFLKIANSVWYDQEYTLNLPFENIARQKYMADVFAEPMDKDSIDKINSWADEKTDGQIKKIMDYSENTPLYSAIFNTIVFDAEWTHKFEPEDTNEGDFYLFNGEKKKVDMLHSYGLWDDRLYFENDYATGFEKTYGKDKRYSFIAVLPKEKGDFKLSDLDLKSFLDSKQSIKTIITMPRFTCDWNSEDSTLNKNNLKLVLKNLNLNGVLDCQILDDLQEESDSRPFQLTKITVDEDGTMAAAETGMPLYGALEEETRYVVLDRPFAYMIKDNQNDEIIFIGKFVQPK
jgi:serpin B